MNSWPTEYPAKKIWEDLRRFSGRRQLNNGAPAEAQRKRVRWGEEEQWNE